MKLHQISSKLILDKKRYPYLVLFFICGVLLMVFPNKSDAQNQSEIKESTSTAYSIEKEEKRLETILSSIDGVEKCKVLLSVHNGAEAILAEDEGETVVLSSSGQQSTVTIQTRYPEFQGAVIVAGGCNDSSVRYDILSSVMAYTGLGADRITICPIKE